MSLRCGLSFLPATRLITSAPAYIFLNKQQCQSKGSHHTFQLSEWQRQSRRRDDTRMTTCRHTGGGDFYSFPFSWGGNTALKVQFFFLIWQLIFILDRCIRPYTQMLLLFWMLTRWLVSASNAEGKTPNMLSNNELQLFFYSSQSCLLDWFHSAFSLFLCLVCAFFFLSITCKHYTHSLNQSKLHNKLDYWLFCLFF